MADKATSIVQLNDHLAHNWSGDASPVAILNPASTLHERIAYCYGLAANLEAVADMGVKSGDGDMRIFASLVSSLLMPLLATLENLGDATAPADGGVSNEGAP